MPTTADRPVTDARRTAKWLAPAVARLLVEQPDRPFPDIARELGGPRLTMRARR